ncbi:hypothetical protein C7I85_27925 [Mesorhizobium soli]|uniref:Uncharacterized protein n=1 Tax=Pseudaminobacter soli (ex Li et al. 2025) TaxID=1295366 RepID=A0A2P7RTY1_9HYPH|nr:hypothetical protein C7I85_27925 [Mesorhizobium soli]
MRLTSRLENSGEKTLSASDFPVLAVVASGIGVVIVDRGLHPLTTRANHAISTLDMAGTSAEMQVSAFLF